MLGYGFQRLVLIGSAGYQRAELPLDDSVSLVAPNNRGKTSLINALQFLLIIDRRRMDFGSYTFEKTRRFYFPNNSAYILLEVVLPQSGTIVLGCVGKGIGYDYEYFAYKGELKVEDYRLDDGSIVSQTKLVSHLARHGYAVSRYNERDFRQMVYGGGQKKGNSEADFTVFKLEHMSDARSFQNVLTRTLRLDKLTSSDVKEYLLQIFNRDLPNASIDFRQEWESAFRDVNLEREQYVAAVENLPLIQNIEQKYNRCLILRGKVGACMPLVNKSLEEWHDYYLSNIDTLNSQLENIDSQRKNWMKEHSDRVTRNGVLTNLLNDLDQKDIDQQLLENRFALITDKSKLEFKAQEAKEKYEIQAAMCVELKRQSAGDLALQLIRMKSQRKSFFRQLETLNDNLFLQLKKLLDESDLKKLNKVLSSQVMQLPPNSYVVDISALKDVLNSSDGKSLALGGLDVSLDKLELQHAQRSEQELKDEIEQLDRQIEHIQELITANENAERADNLKSELEYELKNCEKDSVDYERLQELRKETLKRKEERIELKKEQDRVQGELDGAEARNKQLQTHYSKVEQTITALNVNNDKVVKLREQRIDDNSPFTELANLPCTPWIVDEDWALEYLPERLDSYNEDCREQAFLFRELSQLTNEVASKGLIKFKMSETVDDEIKNIVEFSHCLDKEKIALEKRARSAVVNVTASLRELRSGLWALQSKMKEFNRLISHRQLSDLKIFKIEPVEDEAIMNAINVLIQQAEQAESGQSFDLFDQTSVLEDVQVDRAKSLLIDEGNARQGLKVSDLFRLDFIVAKVDQEPESFEEIDSAASNGTVLMAKLVTGLAMLHLMQDKRHKMKAICYLDEALALDPDNQRNLIDIADEFGFALIFASPAPLTTARYCVPIHQKNGKNYISRKGWQIFEQLEHVELEVML